MSGKVLLKGASGTLMLNVQIPNLTDGGFWPHLTDIYIPAGVAISGACIGLHGGGATKEQFAQQLFVNTGGGIPTIANTNWGILKRAFSILVCPQGQRANASNSPLYNPDGITSNIPTWQNGDQISGVNDLGFVRDLCAWIVDPANFGTIVVALCGHSAGGIMTQACWMQYIAGMPLVYGTLCGPLSIAFQGLPYPAVIKPMMNWYGDQDVNLSVFPDFYASTWVQSKNFNPIDTSYPDPSIRIGDWLQIQNRVNEYAKYKGIATQTVSRTPTSTTLGKIINGVQSYNHHYDYMSGKFSIIENTLSAHPAGQIQGYINLDWLATFMAWAFTNFHG